MSKQDGTTGYMLRGIPRELHAAALERARLEGRTLRWVLVQAIRLYGAGKWTPEVAPMPKGSA